jgi:alpha-beta hydrolase superfamily lysophospholipase
MSSIPRVFERAWLRRSLMIIGLLIGGWLLTSYFVAHWLTRRSAPPFHEPPPRIRGITAEESRLTTADGLELGSWFFQGSDGYPTVLLLHGNGGNRTSSIPQAQMLIAGNYPVLMMTLRAHGDSTGIVNDFGYSARHDVVAAVRWHEAHHPGRPMVIWGSSLGSAAAIFSAPNVGKSVCGYILECPYRDLRTAINRRLKRYLPPLIRELAGCGLTIVAPLVLSDLERISPWEAAARVPSSIPVLLLAGERDSRAFPDEARAIAERMGSQAEIRIMPGAEHLKLLETDSETYRQWTMSFLARFDFD